MSKEIKLEKQLIDIEKLMNDEIQLKSISYRDLLADAAARNNKEAILFLKKGQAQIDERTMKDGRIVKAKHSLGVLRADYLKTYTEYKTKNALASEQRTNIKRNKEIAEYNDLADLALSMIEE